MVDSELRKVIGTRGENIVELCLTDYRAFGAPLFRPGFLRNDWPAIDFYVELTTVKGKHLYFFVQAKATSVPLTQTSTNLNISTKREDIQRLLRIPGPTYIFGIHEPSKRVFARSVHTGMSSSAIKQIPLSHELTSSNLLALHDEVRDFWLATDHKPTTSKFS